MCGLTKPNVPHARIQRTHACTPHQCHSESPQEEQPRSLTEQAWGALQANISEWERGRAEELAAAGVGGLEALAAVNARADGGATAAGVVGGAGAAATGGGDFQSSGGGTVGMLDADVHRLSAVLMQSVPHVS